MVVSVYNSICYLLFKNNISLLPQILSSVASSTRCGEDLKYNKAPSTWHLR